MKKLLFTLFLIIPMYAAHCVDAPQLPADDTAPTEQTVTHDTDTTECATRAFADALAEKLTDVSEDAPESDIEALIYAVFSHGDTLKRVVECPEIKNADETDNIRFLPIKYTFPGGREIVVNYETQPKILTQRLALANKATLPGGGDSPRLGDLNDTSIWTNTDPAWYGIIVTQAGALRNFVGDGNNNTVSLRYIEDNIDTLMPQSSQCTSGSATANDHENINLAAHRTTQDESSQDYYVSGDVNLQWISYLEIGLDVAITVATFGGGAIISGVTKSARAGRVMKNLTTGIRALAKTESVKNYIQLSQKYAKLGKLKRTRITPLDKDLERATQRLAKTSPGSKRHLAQQARVDELTERVRALDKLAIDPNNAAAREVIEKSGSKTARHSMRYVIERGGELKVDPSEVEEMKKIAEEIRQIEKTDKNVQQYKEATKAFSDLNKYRHSLRMTKLPPQRGNVFTRALQRTKDAGRYVKNANTGAKKISEANDIAQKTIKTANKTLKAEAAEIGRIKSALNTDLAHATEQLKNLKPGSAEHIAQQEKIAEMTKQARALENINNTAGLTKEYNDTVQALSKTYKTNDASKLRTALNKDIRQETKRLDNMSKGSKKYIAQQKKIAEMTKQVRTLNKMEAANQEFNATVKTLSKTYKTSKLTKAINGLKTIFGGGQKVDYARASLKGGRLRDWLFHSSMKNAAKLGRMEEATGLLYGAIKFAGDMYDWSETSTGEYTSGIEFKPLLLLSADDIDGQENVVNHGMWLLWQGDTYSAADDDAAYLQAMDFAEKFYRDLLDVQSETNDNSCDIDIYVVRPIIRNPGDPDAELYYLIMNDVPWSTNDE